jgi:glycosyltransferase involved in cell wall biosynthesis
MTVRVAVIVPAWNEASVLPACLSALLAQQGDIRIDAVVAANGCIDSTVAVATSFGERFAAAGHRLQVLDIERAGKPGALNQGDAAVQGDIRVYVDADAVLSPGALAALAASLDEPAARLAMPRVILQLPAAGVARQWATVWQALPPISDDVVGCGCFAVNTAGRRRWAAFPTVIADAAFVCGRFAPHERIVVREETFTVPCPSGDDLLPALVRTLHGNRQLRAARLQAEQPDLHARRVRAVLTQPRLWPALPVYAATVLRARLRARRLLVPAATPVLAEDGALGSS